MMTTRNAALTLAVVLASTVSAFAQSAVSKSAKVDAKGLYEVVFNQTENAVYVTSAGARGEKQGKVLKLDPKTLAVTRTIALSEEAPYGIGLNTKTQTLYTTNTTTGSVGVIDLKTGKPAFIKKEGVKPHFREVLVDEKNNKVYVTVVGKESSIWVIDGATQQLSHIIENVGSTTTGMALDKEANQLYVTNMGDNKVGVIDLEARKVIKSFAAGGERPVNLVFDSKSKRLFVANQGSGDVSVLEAATGKVLKNIPSGAGALGINLDVTRNRLYVANRGTGTVSVIDTVSYEVLAQHKTGSHPNTVAIDPKTGAVYVTNKAKRTTDGSDDPAGDTVTLITP